MSALWPWPWRYDLASRSWQLLGHGQQLCKIVSRSNMAVRNSGFFVWPCVKVMTHPWVMDNSCVKYYPDPSWQWGIMARTRILGICAMLLELSNIPLGQGHYTSLVHGPIVWNIIQMQHGSEELWSGHIFRVYVHCDLGDMTLSQGHGTPLGHGQQLCEILSRSNMVVKSYCPDTDFGYVCTVTLTLERRRQVFSWRRHSPLPPPPVTYFYPRRICPQNKNAFQGPWILHPYQVSSKYIMRRSWI